MPRKLIWILLFHFANLALLPGCLHCPFCRGGRCDKVEDPGPAKAAEEAKNKNAGEDKKPFSKASMEKDAQSTSKMLAGPLRKDASDSQRLPTLDQQKSGTPEGPEPMPVKSASLLSEPKTVEKKREDALLLAFKAFLDKRHDEAIRHLREFDNDTQEFLIRLFPLFVMVAQKPMSEFSSAEVAVVYDQLVSAQVSLRPRCELAVSNFCFCQAVQGYGLYKPLPSNHVFVAGTKDPAGDKDRLGEEVYLYVELKNLTNEKTKEGDYLTRLSCVLELYDASNKKVWTQRVDRSDTPHRRRTPMYDFYRNYIFYVPAIPPGTYRLTMQIADETNPAHRRVARQSLAFRVTPATD
jgi:hypothetical protein